MIPANNIPAPPDSQFAILMACYNGQQFLNVQMESIKAQTVDRIDVWASDDGSSDATVAMLHSWAERWDKGFIRVLSGPRQGFAANFRSLLQRAEMTADFIAFCDQDDLWEAGKLAEAAEWLHQQGEVPAVFCGRTLSIDENGRESGLSPLFRRPPSFRNALVQSIAGGNTMVLNRAAWALMAEAARRTGFLSHDWWTYLMVSGAGGRVRYAAAALVRYRQHAGNLVGENNSWAARLHRAGTMFQGRFRTYTDANLASLEACQDMLTPEAAALVDAFKRARQSFLPLRLWRLWRAGLYRQSALQQVGLYVAAALNRL